MVPKIFKTSSLSQRKWWDNHNLFWVSWIVSEWIPLSQLGVDVTNTPVFPSYGQATIFRRKKETCWRKDNVNDGLYDNENGLLSPYPAAPP